MAVWYPQERGTNEAVTDFLGDTAILIGTFVVDVALLGAWYWLITRVDSISADDPLPPDDGADLTRDENWYYVQVPVLTKVIIGRRGRLHYWPLPGSGSDPARGVDPIRVVVK